MTPQKKLDISRKVEKALCKAYQESMELENVPKECRDSASASRAVVEHEEKLWYFMMFNLASKPEYKEYSVDLGEKK